MEDANCDQVGPSITWYCEAWLKAGLRVPEVQVRHTVSVQMVLRLRYPSAELDYGPVGARMSSGSAVDLWRGGCSEGTVKKSRTADVLLLFCGR